MKTAAPHPLPLVHVNVNAAPVLKTTPAGFKQEHHASRRRPRAVLRHSRKQSRGSPCDPASSELTVGDGANRSKSNPTHPRDASREDYKAGSGSFDESHTGGPREEARGTRSTRISRDSGEKLKRLGRGKPFPPMIPPGRIWLRDMKAFRFHSVCYRVRSIMGSTILPHGYVPRRIFARLSRQATIRAAGPVPVHVARSMTERDTRSLGSSASALRLWAGIEHTFFHHFDVCASPRTPSSERALKNEAGA